MPVIYSPETLPTLLVQEPVAKPELRPLGLTSEVVKADLPELSQVVVVDKAIDLPSLSFKIPARPAEVILPALPEKVSTIDSVVVPKPVPAIVSQPSKLKPAVKIGHTTVARKLVKSAVAAVVLKSANLGSTGAKLRSLDDRAIGRAKVLKASLSEKKDKLQSIKLKERSSQLGKAAVAVVVLKSANLGSTGAKLRSLDDRTIGRAKVLKASISEKKDNLNLSKSISDAPYKAKIFVSNRLEDLNKSRLNETLGDNKKYLFMAIGVVAFAGSTYLKFRGYQGHDDLTDTMASGASPASGSQDIVSEKLTGPDKPIKSLPIIEQATDLSDSASTVGDSIEVNQGDGIGDLISDRAADNGVKLSGSEIYDIYQELDIKMDGELITGDTYRMPNGDLGISSPGTSAWQEQAQRALDEIIEAKKKKKS